MGLHDVIRRVRGREKTLTVYTSTESSLVPALRRRFADQNLAVERADPGDGPEHAVLSDDGEYLTSVSVAALGDVVSGATTPGERSDPFGSMLTHLDRSTFTSYSRRQMLAASREIEDRAWRRGEGRLHAGFQQLSNFERERDTYRLLAASDLDVVVYGVPDEAVDVPRDLTVEATRDPEVAATWFVVYDGGGDAMQASAVLAEERERGEYFGVWTYDTDLVEAAVDALAGLREEA